MALAASDIFGVFRDLRTRYLLRACRVVGRDAEVIGSVWIHGRGSVILGNRVVLDGSVSPIELKADSGATITLGDDVHISGGTSIEALESVVIGERCKIAGFCKIMDNHFHLIDRRGERPPSRPVVLEADVGLGTRVIVLPGGYLGRGSRVAPGTVIGRRVPPDVTVSGQPPTVRAS